MAKNRRYVPLVVIGFLAGAISVFVFHQGFIFIAWRLGVLPNAPYSLEPTAPLGVPRVISSAFWGGLWGIALALLLDRLRRTDWLWVGILFGGILLPLAGILVVTPLKGGEVVWPSSTMLLRGFIINGVWGLGAALLYRLGRAFA
jgi:hypothetical protein